VIFFKQVRNKITFQQDMIVTRTENKICTKLNTEMKHLWGCSILIVDKLDLIKISDKNYNENNTYVKFTRRKKRFRIVG
jgi:hypothetical protein